MPTLKKAGLPILEKPIYTREQALDDYSSELGNLQILKSEGVSRVEAHAWFGSEFPIGQTVNIDEVIQQYESKIAQISQLDEGANASDFAY